MPAFIVLVVDENADPIADAVVGLFTEQGVPLMSDTTAQDGRAPFVSPDELIAVRAAKAGFAFARNTFMRPVEGATFTVVGGSWADRYSTDPQKCVVYGHLEDPLGGQFKGSLPLKVTLLGRISGEPVDVMTTSVADVPVIRGGFNMELRRGWQYKLGPLPVTDVNDKAPDFEFITFNVPDRASANFIDLASPYMTAIANVPAAVRLTEDSPTASYALSGLLSDDTYAKTLAEYIQAELTATGIATVALTLNTLTITRIAAGQVNVGLVTKEAAQETAESSLFSGRARAELAEFTVTCV